MNATPMNRQRGVFMIEAMVGILIFSVGILALIALQASAISAQSDAQYRSEAAHRADQIASQMQLNVNRSTDALKQAAVAGFEYNVTTNSTCNFSGGLTTAPNTVVTDWVASVTAGATALPGTTTSMVQILPATGTFNRVTINVCWKTTNDAVARRLTYVTFIN